MFNTHYLRCRSITVTYQPINMILYLFWIYRYCLRYYLNKIFNHNIKNMKNTSPKCYLNNNLNYKTNIIVKIYLYVYILLFMILKETVNQTFYMLLVSHNSNL